MHKISLRKAFYSFLFAPKSKMRFSFAALFLGFFVFVSDFFSKQWIVAYLSPAERIPVLENFYGVQFHITHMTNRGAAWGFFSDYPKALIVLRIVIILFICGLFLLSHIPKKNYLPMSLILGGAMGNVLDFFLFGHVVDLFSFVFWRYAYPVFNVADSAIFCGVVLLVLQWLRVKNQQFAK